MRQNGNTHISSQCSAVADLSSPHPLHHTEKINSGFSDDSVRSHSLKTDNHKSSWSDGDAGHGFIPGNERARKHCSISAVSAVVDVDGMVTGNEGCVDR